MENLHEVKQNIILMNKPELIVNISHERIVYCINTHEGSFQSKDIRNIKLNLKYVLQLQEIK